MLAERFSDKEKNVNSQEKVPLVESVAHSKWEVFKMIKLEAFLVFYVFFVTLSFFPGITSLIKVTDAPIDSGWFAVLMIFAFQIFDFVGRSMPRLILFPKRILWIPVILRTSIVVLFILCIKPQLITQFYWPFIFMALFAVTNGYTGTLCMMYGPQGVGEEDKEIAGMIMSFFLNSGILFAVFFALLLLWLIGN